MGDIRDRNTIYIIYAIGRSIGLRVLYVGFKDDRSMVRSYDDYDDDGDDILYRIHKQLTIKPTTCWTL